MANGIKMDYEEMADSSKKLLAEGEAMSDCINKITEVVEHLPDIWTAETADRYVEQYSSLKPSLEDAMQLIYDMAKQMDQIVSNFQETDSGMAGQM